MNPFQGKSGCFFLAPFVLSPSEIAAAGACAPVKNCSCLLAVVLRLLGKQASLAFRVRCLVSIPQVRVLKVETPKVGSKPFTQGEPGSWKYPPNCVHCASSGVCDQSVSQAFLPISMRVFSCSPNVQELLSQVLYIFQREFLCMQLYILCVHGGEEEEFRSLLCHLLGQLSSYSFILN